MNIFKRLIIFILALAMLFSFSGCQGNNSEVIIDIPEPEPPVIDVNVTILLPVTTYEVTSNEERVIVEVKAVDKNNNPYSTGNVHIVYPQDVVENRDVGLFDESIVAMNESGIASFFYTAPKNLEEDISNINFEFYHEEAVDVKLQYIITINPSEDQKILNNFTLNSDIENDVNMGLDADKQVAFFVKNDKSELVIDSNVIWIRISSMNPSLATLEDIFGNTGDSLTLYAKNSVSLNVKSNTKSGLVPLKVEARFRDANDNLLDLVEIFNIIVLSGPPSAMSLSYAGTVHEEEHKDRAKFVERWVLTVTDKYNNLVNTNPAVSMGMIAGFANDSSGFTANDSNYLFYSPDTTASGTLNKYSDSFRAPQDVFDDVDIDNDLLVTFGKDYTYNASGKWDIDAKSSSVLSLSDDYTSTTTSGLGFAVGHNHRGVTCSDDGSSVVANVYPDDGNYTIDETGTAIINVEYDYYLTGKSTVLWVNLVGRDYATDTTIRIGEAKKVNLRGKGLDGESYAFSKGFNGTVRLNVSVSDTVEWYYNSNFGYQVTVTGEDTNWSILGDSNGRTTSCYNSGVGYVDINITAAESGTVSLTNVLPSHEF
ncbi:MAG: hypothetical protein U9N33_11865 [Campylobacterota bacterium]|nr:hypothetical protein [Campylobacterota bacterium]